MKQKRSIHQLGLIGLLTLLSVTCVGQFRQTTLLDVGSSTISDGSYLRPAILLHYNYKTLHVSNGFQWTFSSAERKTFSGGYVSGGADLSVAGLAIQADAFFRINPYSKLTKESNFGFILKHERKHIDLQLGYHMRHYKLNSTYMDASDLQADPDLHIWEYRNFIYLGSLHLNENDAIWNFSLNVTNVDYFAIQQETNPMFFLRANYRLSEMLNCHMEIWYQGAGMLNLHPNHYGAYFRTGIVWLLEK